MVEQQRQGELGRSGSLASPLKAGAGRRSSRERSLARFRGAVPACTREWVPRNRCTRRTTSLRKFTAASATPSTGAQQQRSTVRVPPRRRASAKGGSASGHPSALSPYLLCRSGSPGSPGRADHQRCVVRNCGASVTTYRDQRYHVSGSALPRIGISVTTYRDQRYHVSGSAISRRNGGDACLEDTPSCTVNLNRHFAGGLLGAQRFARFIQAFPARARRQVQVAVVA